MLRSFEETFFSHASVSLLYFGHGGGWEEVGFNGTGFCFGLKCMIFKAELIALCLA